MSYHLIFLLKEYIETTMWSDIKLPFDDPQFYTHRTKKEDGKVLRVYDEIFGIS